MNTTEQTEATERLIDLLKEAATEIYNLDCPDNPVRQRLLAEALKLEEQS